MDDMSQNVNILPDKMSWIPERLRGGWMLKDNFTFNIVFDFRKGKFAALQREFNGAFSFKQKVDLWEDKPYIHASNEVPEHHDNNSTLYHLKAQGAIVHISSYQ